MGKIIFVLSAVVVAVYLAFFMSRPTPPRPSAKFSSYEQSGAAKAQRGSELQVVNRRNKTDALAFIIYIHDGPNGGEVTEPMSRRRAEAELKNLYADADAEILIPDERGGYRFAGPGASKKVRRLVSGAPGEE